MKKNIFFAMALTMMAPLTAHAVPCFHDIATHYSSVEWIEQLFVKSTGYDSHGHEGDANVASGAGPQGSSVARGGGIGHAVRGPARVDGRPAPWGTVFGGDPSVRPPLFVNGLPTLEINNPQVGLPVHVIPPIGGHDPAVAGTTPVPEPTTLLLFGTGLIGLAAVGRRKR